MFIKLTLATEGMETCCVNTEYVVDFFWNPKGHTILTVTEPNSDGGFRYLKIKDHPDAIFEQIRLEGVKWITLTS